MRTKAGSTFTKQRKKSARKRLQKVAWFIYYFVFSWLPFVRCPLIFTGIVLGLVQISNSFYATIQFNREYLGRTFVFFKVCRSLPGFYARSRMFSILD